MMARTWRQPNCLSTDEWIRVWYIYITGCYLAIKKNEIIPSAATWMDLDCHAVWRKSEKENVMWYHICVLSVFKKGYKWTYLQNRNSLRFRKQRGKRDKLGDWNGQIHTAAAAAELLPSCLTLCDPTDGSPPGSPVPGILQARTLEWVAISFSSAWKWKV